MLDSTSTYPPPDDTPAAVSSPSAPVETRHRKVAILGFGATAKDCPWQDPSWELWAMNGWWRAAEPDHGVKAPEDRYTLWFDMHTLEYTRAYGKAAGFGDAQERWLEKPHPFPIFTLDHLGPAYPSTRAFPIEDVVAKVGRDYFTSTVAYVLAYALTLPDVAEIGLWGIDLVHDTEYSEQRPCAEYWAGRAEALGIKVTIHEQSALLRQRTRYGYEAATPLLGELRGMLAGTEQRLAENITKGQAEQARLAAQAHTDDGALQIVRHVLQRLEIWERGGQV